MTDQRRYDRDEVKKIFEAATTAREAGPRALTTGDGLTLAELQTIGLEVGLAPERVAEAATALDLRRDALPRRTNLGMPIAVGRTVDLPRAPTDREWELLVAELRETFRAQGGVRSYGSLRQWTNGNLHAYIEPTETGHRLRMRTLKGSAGAINAMGAAGIALALALFVMGLLTGKPAVDFFMPAVFAAMGGAALASNVLTLPRWAREREEQMEYIAKRARALLASAPDTDESAR